MLQQFIAANYNTRALNKQLILAALIFSTAIAIAICLLLPFAITLTILAQTSMLTFFGTLLLNKMMGWSSGLHEFCHRVQQEQQERIALNLAEKNKINIEAKALDVQQKIQWADNKEKVSEAEIWERKKQKADKRKKEEKKNTQKMRQVEREKNTRLLDQAIYAGSVQRVQQLLATGNVDFSQGPGLNVYRTLINKEDKTAENLEIFKLLVKYGKKSDLLEKIENINLYDDAISIYRTILQSCESQYCAVVLEAYPELVWSFIEEPGTDHHPVRNTQIVQPLYEVMSNIILVDEVINPEELAAFKSTLQVLFEHGLEMDTKIPMEDEEGEEEISDLEFRALLSVNVAEPGIHYCNFNISSEEYAGILALCESTSEKYQENSAKNPTYLKELEVALKKSPQDALALVIEKSKFYKRMPFHFLQMAQGILSAQEMKQLSTLYPPTPNDACYQNFCYEIANYFYIHRSEDETFLREAMAILIQAILADSGDCPEKQSNIIFFSRIFNSGLDALDFNESLDFEIDAHEGSTRWLAVVLLQFQNLYNVLNPKQTLTADTASTLSQPNSTLILSDGTTQEKDSNAFPQSLDTGLSGSPPKTQIKKGL